MSARKSVAHRLGRILETVTRQSGRLPETPAYGSLLLGPVSESPRRRSARVQAILTVLVVAANLTGVAVTFLLVTVAVPEPSVFTDAPGWLTFAAVPAFIAVALALGTFWITRQVVIVLRWAIEERAPSPEDERNTFLAPWRVAVVDLFLWAAGAVVTKHVEPYTTVGGNPAEVIRRMPVPAAMAKLHRNSGNLGLNRIR